MAAPLRTLNSCLAAIRDNNFRPDEYRSGMLAAEYLADVVVTKTVDDVDSVDYEVLVHDNYSEAPSASLEEIAHEQLQVTVASDGDSSSSSSSD